MIGLPECGPGEMLLPDRGGYIIPSNINPWRELRRPDRRYTDAQLRVMPLYQLDPATCDDVVVRSSVSMQEYSWPLGTRAPVYLLPCPIISRKGDGAKCLVISPTGLKKWVYADGSITKRRQADPEKAPRGRTHWRRG